MVLLWIQVQTLEVWKRWIFQEVYWGEDYENVVSVISQLLVLLSSHHCKGSWDSRFIRLNIWSPFENKRTDKFKRSVFFHKFKKKNPAEKHKNVIIMQKHKRRRIYGYHSGHTDQTIDWKSKIYQNKTSKIILIVLLVFFINLCSILRLTSKSNFQL